MNITVSTLQDTQWRKIPCPVFPDFITMLDYLITTDAAISIHIGDEVSTILCGDENLAVMQRELFPSTRIVTIDQILQADVEIRIPGEMLIMDHDGQYLSK